jgi:hypothetical protein
MSLRGKFLLSLTFITLINAASAQEITLEQGGAIMINGGSNSVGSSAIGSGRTVLFRLHNPSNTNLNLTGTPRVAISGPNAADFIVNAQPNSPVEPSGPVVVTNAGFEYPAYDVGIWIQNPPGAGWTCGFSSGICRNGSPWYINPAPEGNQAAFIQTNGAGAFISRSINFTATANYLIRFKLVRRSSIYPANDIDVRMDGVTLGTIMNTEQPDDVWRTFSVSYTCTNAGNHTLAFVGTRGGGDYASCIDDVEFVSGTTFAITFTPSAEGLRTATLSIPSDSTNNPFNVVLTGTAIPPVKIISPTVVGSNVFRFTAGGPTNVQYFKVYGSAVLTTNKASWPLLAVGDPGQTNFDVTVPWTNGGFFYITTNYYDTQNPIPVVFQFTTRASQNSAKITTNTFVMASQTETDVFTMKLDAYKNFFNMSIVGDFTNHYTYDWRVEVIGGEDDYANLGMTGYLTPTLEIAKNSLPDGFDVNFHFVITRKADGYSTEYLLYAHIINSQLDLDMASTCQGASTACPIPTPTCPCSFTVALPTTEPH